MVRHILAIRGLLQWMGWWKPLVTAAAAAGVTLWSYVEGIRGPVLLLIALVFFVFVLIGWRAFTYPRNQFAWGDRVDIAIGNVESGAVATQAVRTNSYISESKRKNFVEKMDSLTTAEKDALHYFISTGTPIVPPYQGYSDGIFVSIAHKTGFIKQGFHGYEVNGEVKNLLEEWASEYRKDAGNSA
jgi:hypothetical protein